jgi:predicted dinucleotide-binding enzyme
MSHAIIGFGKIGQALAHAFARRNIEVAVASRHPPEALASLAQAIGPTIVAKSLQEALKADMIFLAIRSESHPDLARALPSWEGKTLVDATNSQAPLEEMDGLLSSAFVARLYAGAKVVKGFNHLGVFLSSDDAAATVPVAALAKQLGFAPVNLGRFDEGGALVHARFSVWGPLIFQDMFKKEQ